MRPAVSTWLQDLLHSPLLSRLRRNHALEHATIHVLNARYPNTTLIGRADGRGFYLFGELPTDAVQEAVRTALARLQAGERRLAIHPNCGTNFLTAGVLAGLASFFSLLGRKGNRWRDRLDRLPLAIAVTILALVVAQPLGAAVQQRFTTEGDPGGLEVLSVKRLPRGRSTVHRIFTRG
jgi:hypothetical protein